MNVASLELCKELYQLSGWIGTYGYWDTDAKVWATTDLDGAAVESPAYDLGYLLRKLPPTIKASKNDSAFLTLGAIHTRNWIISYKTVADTIYPKDCYGEADTPENALCQLAIELIKQRILTPTNRTEEI